MSLKDRVLEFFSNEEDVEASLNDADEVFKSRKKRKIEKAQRKADDLIDETDQILDELKSSLEELKEYEDSDDIQAVEDVAENFYRSRKNLIEDFESSEDIEEHFETLDTFVEEFNDVSRKEGVVMQRVEQSSGVLSERINEIVEHRDRIDDLLEQEYGHVTQLEIVRNSLDKIENLEEEKDGLKNSIESTEDKIDSLEDKIKSKEQKIDDLKSGEAWERRENLLGKLDYLKSKRDNQRKKISSNVSELERGLKKLLYKVDNSDTVFEGDLDKLRELKEGEFASVSDPFDELEEALSLILEEDLLDDRQLGKFEDAVEKFDTFEEDRRELEEYEKEIENKKEEFKDFEIGEEKKDLENEIENRKKELEKRKDDLQDMKERNKEKEEEIVNEIKELESFMEKALNVDVSLEREA